MYKIKDNINLSLLRSFGFKKGNEWPEYKNWICNKSEYDDYWLIPMNPDEPDVPHYAEGELLLWSIHVQPSRRLWIDCVPCCTYHIDNMDMEEMFYTLKLMMNLIEDDYHSNLFEEIKESLNDAIELEKKEK